MMKKKTYLSLLLIGFLVLVNASQVSANNIGIRYGNTVNRISLSLYDLYGSLDLPWSWNLGPGWTMRSDIEGILSILDGDGDSSFNPSIMTKLIFTSPNKRFDWLAGFGVGALTGSTEFVDHDLGGPLFFQGTLGARFGLTENLFAGLRYYHQSNFSIYDSNDSLNLLQGELVWEF